MSCVVRKISNAASFLPMRFGQVNKPNQLTEKFFADDMVQPVSGMANSST